MKSLILRTAARVILPVFLLFSIFLLVRGHNEPGGGFAGGLVAAAAFALYSLSAGVSQARGALRMDPHALIGSGLLLAILSGAWGLALGQPFMTDQWGKIAVAGLGTLDVGTPLLFDIGVYLVVLGVTMLIILTLTEE